MTIANKIIIQIVRYFLIVGTVIFLTWNITKADTFNQNLFEEKPFNASGVVYEVSPSSLSINKALGSNNKNQDNYIFDLNFVNNLETNNYEPINLSDIKVGDRVIVKGQETFGRITIQRIISFDYSPSVEEIVATSTIATSSEEVISTTSTSSTESSTSTLQTITESISGVISNVIDSIIGVFTSTSTDDVLEDPINIQEEESVNINTDNQSIQENNGFIDTVKETMNFIMENVTGGSEQESSPVSNNEESSSAESELNIDSETNITNDSVSEVSN